jgi:hypothetical protein
LRNKQYLKQSQEVMPSFYCHGCKKNYKIFNKKGNEKSFFRVQVDNLSGSKTNFYLCHSCIYDRLLDMHIWQ